MHEGRTRAELAHRSSVDEVADPYGGPPAGYRAAAEELAALTGELAGLLWPDADHDEEDANRAGA